MFRKIRTTTGMHWLISGLLALGVLVVGCTEPATPVASTATVFEGATLIVGDGRTIDNATFVVDQSRFVAVGAAGEVAIPEGAARINLTDRTVMPAIVDAHTHLSTTREALVADLRSRAYFGVGAALSLGTDGEDAPLEIRDEQIPGAARYKSAGRGITSPEPGRSDVPHWVTTVDDARQAVRDEVTRDVDMIKIWVDTRNGQYEKLNAELYGAVIDEAHRAERRVSAHIFELADAKSLLAAGVDSFAHGVRDRDVDDEFVTMVRQRPNVVLIPNMPGRGVPTDLAWLERGLTAEAFSAAQAANVERPEIQEAFGIQARNLARLSEAGMTIALGTDGNTPWAPHVEMEDMVAAGMSPADVLVSATRNAAAFAGFDDLGTVEAGKSAEFVVLEDSPLDDIRNTRRIVDVYLRGAAIDRRGSP